MTERECRMLRVSDSGAYEPIGEIGDWDEVKAAADEIAYVTGLLGWMPYTAHYSVVVGGERLHYLVADPLYGLAELARAVGWTVQKLSTYRGRKGRDGKALVPKPTFETASGPVWTHGDAAEFILRCRDRLRSTGGRPIDSAYDRDFAAVTERLIADLRKAGHEVETPVTGAVIVDSIEIPADSWDGVAAAYSQERDIETAWDCIQEKFGARE